MRDVRRTCSAFLWRHPEHPATRAICAAIVVASLAYFGLHLVLDRHAFGASMNAQQEAVALYLHWEKRGFDPPSVRSISRALRDQGVRFREADLRKWLRPFLEKAGRVPNQAPASGLDGTQKTSTGDAVGRTELSPDAPRTRLRAHVIVPLVSEESLSHTPREAAKDFAAWFCREGIAAHAISEHHGLDPNLWARNSRSVAPAEGLLATYDRAEVERRAYNLFAVKVAGKLPQAITVADLAKHWDSADVAGTARPKGGVSDSARARAERYRAEHST